MPEMPLKTMPRRHHRARGACLLRPGPKRAGGRPTRARKGRARTAEGGGLDGYNARAPRTAPRRGPPSGVAAVARGRAQLDARVCTWRARARGAGVFSCASVAARLAPRAHARPSLAAMSTVSNVGTPGRAGAEALNALALHGPSAVPRQPKVVVSAELAKYIGTSFTRGYTALHKLCKATRARRGRALGARPPTARRFTRLVRRGRCR